MLHLNSGHQFHMKLAAKSQIPRTMLSTMIFELACQQNLCNTHVDRQSYCKISEMFSKHFKTCNSVKNENKKNLQSQYFSRM